jgi:hypothetical protein
MGTTAEKLTHLSQTKSDIRDAIEAKGVSVPVETTFRDYATKVSDIKTDFSDTFNYAERVSQDGGSVENLAEVANLDINDGAKLNFIPSGKKTGKSYSQVPTDGSGDWTVDRNCEAPYIDKDGVMQTAQANEPRYDWSSGSPVLLREGQSTNLMLSSENFNNNNWINNEATIIGQTEIFIDGISKMTEVKGSNTVNFGQIYQKISLADNTNYSYTLYIKKGTSDKVRFGLFESGGAGWLGYIELKFTGNTPYVDNNVGCSNVGVSPEINNIYRVQFYITTPTLSQLVDYQVHFDRNGSGKSLHICGAQLEEGDTATSYVKTEGATVTRLADIIETTPPTGTTQIIETIDGVEQTPITTIPATYQIPEGNINQIKML